MWIMLIKTLPTRPTPPKFGIFWSTPWPSKRAVKSQKKMYAQFARGTHTDYRPPGGPYWEDEPDFFWDSHNRKDPNMALARRINYQGQDLRVLPHEFSEQDAETMRLFVYGVEDDEHDTASHVLMSGNISEDILVKGVLDGETRPIYEAALIDGANEAQAMNTALGVDITLPDAHFPPVGWYRPRLPYAEIFCEDWELEPLLGILAETGETI